MRTPQIRHSPLLGLPARRFAAVPSPLAPDLSKAELLRGAPDLGSRSGLAPIGERVLRIQQRPLALKSVIEFRMEADQ
jgi:hypothetical protein